MPITFFINRDEKLMVSRYVGDIDDNSFILSYKTMLRSGKFELGFDELVDMTKLKNFTITWEGVKGVQSLVDEKFANSTNTVRTAVVALENLPFGLARMYELYKEERLPEEIMVFRTMLEALKWLKREHSLIQDVESWERVTT
ncbi:hypothetical protein D1BOALGB6SA_4219 [Olavius sp. associated proteobacterium Delta 1]|nr:hypothetical protein D1BOALGB6SA_4219 [Olavius sp. associated proteobacterium Delta 1]